MPRNLPNLLTLSRIAAIPLLVALMAYHTAGADLAACALFAIAGFTDWLDGRIARQRKLQSELGRMLDPIADKLLVGATLMALAGMNRLSPMGLYPAIVIMCREILVSGLREYLAALAVRLPVTRLAKWKTGLQMAAIGTLLAGDPGAARLGLAAVPVSAIGEVMLWVAALLTLVTGWDYLLAGVSSVVSQSSGGSRPAPGEPGPRPKSPAAPALFMTTDE
jgi:cardiolipin synthase (CMP-forming)